MRIMIDIGHPSHVHYFKNFIWEMKSKGHEFLITAREKDITHQLLNKYNMEFISRGKGKKGFLGKLIYMLQADFKLFRIARRFNPDTFISCASPYAAHSAKLLKVQNITLDDTDIANLSHIMYVPFTDCIISPKGFKKNFGKKHILIDSTFDLFYLHPKYFTPNSLVKEELGLESGKKTIFMRFTSMSATHDWSHKKISYKDKLFLINSLKEKYKILISSEYKLPDEINQFKITLSPEKIHDALYFSDLFIGESGSMSTEAAIMGVPSINLTSSASDVGVFTQLVECKMLHLISNAKQTLDKAIEILNNENYHQNTLRLKVNEFISKKVDMTSLLVWFIENYPDSINVMKENPNYQDHFK